MAFPLLNEQFYPLEVATAYNSGFSMSAITSSNVNSTGVVGSFELGAIVMTTDTMTVYMHNGTAFVPIAGYESVASVSGNTTLTDVYQVVKVTAACTITLPAASGRTNKIFEIMATADNVIVDGNAAETIQDELTQTLVSGDSMRIICDGSGWRFI